MPYQIIRNDIVAMAVDAIVNPTDAVFSGSGGVDARVHFAAGSQMRTACDQLPVLDMGQVAVTEGFQLPCRYVIHTFGPIWLGGGHREKELLSACYRNALHAARKLDCKTVATPLISSGTFGYPKDKVLRVALEAITDFLMQFDMTVYLLVYDRQSYEISKRLQADIDSYIDANYIARQELVFDPYTYSYQGDTSAAATPPAQPESPPVVSTKPTASLSSMLDEMEQGFAQTLFRFIDEKGLTDTECYKRANVDRRVFSKIKTKSSYSPTKETIVSFAVALKLSLDETIQLLSSAGLTLSHSNRFDIIIEYFIKTGNYDMMDINEALYQYGQPCIGNVIE